MSRKDLRKVEIIVRWELTTLPGPGQTVIGEDYCCLEGWFHGWDSSSGDLKGIIELEEGDIMLIPFKDIKFID